ncbi:MAG TPA: LysR substrate-binding domain-containing protein [Ramlibacter sp.]|nr:LysR substrate-binding domain-containing protein [Ramlibacter sp.]
MNLTWLDDFLALAASGNFSRAAEARHSSQPAFSRRIRGLEEWLGADLFDRSTQPARLTEAGEWFRGVAEELVARVARLPGEAKAVAEASSGTLRIASTHALSFTFLPDWLRRIEARAPFGPVQLMSDVLQQCETLMLHGKVHFVLGHAHAKAQGPLDADPYTSAGIGSDLLVPVSRPDGRGLPRHSLSNAAGAPTQLLQFSAESGLGRIVRAVFGRRLEALPAQVAFTAHLASVLRTMALDGRGLAWLPRSLVEDDLGQGRLVEAGGPEWRIPLGIRLYRDRAFAGKTAEDFWEFVTSATLAM